MKPRLVANVAANFVGRGFASLLGLLLFPGYSAALGAEGFGLVAFYLTFQSVLTFLDLGLNATVVRQAAWSHQHSEQSEAKVRQLVSTLEWWYWCVGLLIAASTFMLAAPIAAHWIKAASVDPETIHQVVLLMGLSVGLQWPSMFYSSVMMGLQKQVRANVTLIAISLLRWGGAACVLWLSPDIVTFFWWQVLSSGLGSVCSRLVLRSAVRGARQPVSWPMFRKLMLDLRPMIAITVSATLLSQLDRIVLSASVPLDVFGHYSLAIILASTLFLLAIPFQSAAMPQFSGLMICGDQASLEKLYRRMTQACAAILMPTAATLIVFSHELVSLWTGTAATTAQVAPLLSILAIGSCINASMYLPLGLQLASGITRTALVSNLISVAIQAPMLLYLARNYSVTAVALSWAVFNLLYVAVVPVFIHRKLLPDALRDWWLHSLILPFGLSLLVMQIAHSAAAMTDSIYLKTMIMITAAGIALCTCVLSSPTLRDALKDFRK